MEKLLLSISVLFLITSCENEDTYSAPTKQLVQTDCPYIFATGEDKEGSYIVLTKNHSNTSDRMIYRVKDYKDYQLRQRICDTKTLN